MKALKRSRAIIIIGILFSMTSPTIAGETQSGDVLIGFGGELSVGNTGFGQYTLDGGSFVIQQAVDIASGPSAIGEVNITDAGTTLSLIGSQNRLVVGASGDGAMTISSGAFTDGAANPTACNDIQCNFFIANAAGSTGALTVSGSGSRLDTLNTFVIGGAAVFTQANDGFDFGVPGGESSATLDILAGGVVNSVNATISGGPGGGSPTGTERTSATVTVSGSSSALNIGDGQLSISSGPNARGYLLVDDGGIVTVAGWRLSASQVDTSYSEIRIESGGEVRTGILDISDGAGSETILSISAGRLVGTETGTHSQWNLANSGKLRLDISNGGELSTDALVFVSKYPESNAHIKLRGKDSIFEAGVLLSFGWDYFGNSPGGTCTVVLTPGTIIRAQNIIVGPNCKVVGRGRLEGTVYNLGGKVGAGVVTGP